MDSGWNLTLLEQANQLSDSGWNLTLLEQTNHLSLTWIVFISTLYSLTTLFSIVGNVLVIVVFARGRRSRTDLRPFLINLAIADLIMALFCMPFTFADAIFKEWLFSRPMCPIVLFMQNLSVSASVFINVAIGVDRFIVVTYPLYSKATQARAKYTIATTWMLSLVIASVIVPIADTEEIYTKMICKEFWPFPESKRIYTMVIFMSIYVVPFCVLIGVYSCIGFVLWKRTAPGNRDHMRDMMQLRSKIKVSFVIMFGIRAVVCGGRGASEIFEFCKIPRENGRQAKSLYSRQNYCPQTKSTGYSPGDDTTAV